MLTSKFFYGDDERFDSLDGFELPSDWWSRPHEYAWASKFLKDDEIIIDAGCGTNHPFKDYAAARVKKIFAIDKDPAIKQFNDTDTLMHVHSDICKLDGDFAPKSIDKVFCISVLEHMYPVNIVDALKQFKTVLKDDGQIILTMDYPYLMPETLISLVNDAGLCFAGSVDYDFDKHKAIKGSYGNLKCYRAVLCKPEDETETKPVAPKETKPVKPKKTK